MSPRSDARPVIGICAVCEEVTWSFWRQEAHLVASSYVRMVQRSGASVVLLAIDPHTPEALLNTIDGLMLIGGVDIDPGCYGAERAATTETTAPARDTFEIRLVRAAAHARMPVLGICRGMQIINVAFGGTLLQDLRAADGTTTHRRRLGSFDDTDHLVRTTPDSLVARATGEPHHRVHCHHHQAIDVLGDGLVVSARDETDGVTEALEAADGSWLLGVQWHPEAGTALDLTRAFVEACRVHAAAGARRLRCRLHVQPRGKGDDRLWSTTN